MDILNILFAMFLVILFIEGITELVVGRESIVHKWLAKFFNLNLVPAKIGMFLMEAINCGFCFSLQVAILSNLFWLYTPHAIFYPMFVVATWRLSNLYHTFNSWLMRLKMFTGGKVG